MKSIFIAIITLLPFLAASQTVSINEFYRKYKNSDAENTHLSLPGWLVKLGVGIAKADADEEDKEALDLVKKVGKVRILTFEDSNPVSRKDLDRLTERVRRENFEDLVMVRDKGANVKIMIREKGELVKNVLILVSETDSFTMVSLKTRVKYDQIEDLINESIDEEGSVEVKL